MKFSRALVFLIMIFLTDAVEEGELGREVGESSCTQGSSAFINEFHYDNSRRDENEFVEILIPGDQDLTKFSIVVYNGKTNAPYGSTRTLDSGTVHDSSSTITIDSTLVPVSLVVIEISGLQNGPADGIALIRNCGEEADSVVVDFVCYEGQLTASEGPAANSICQETGVSESSSTSSQSSLARVGSGLWASSFSWAVAELHSRGQINPGQTLTSTNQEEGGGCVPACYQVPTTLVPTSAPTTLVPTSAPTTLVPTTAPTTLVPTLAPDLGPTQVPDVVSSNPTAGNGGCLATTTTLISDIQGSSSASPLVGTIVTVRGILTADLQRSDQLKGFFMQQTSETTDGIPTTSEGIFVYTGSSPSDATRNDLVQVTATVKEYYGLTRLTTVSNVEICSSGNTGPGVVQLPRLPKRGTEDEALERYEGMLVSIPSAAVVEVYNLGKYGQLKLSTSGRNIVPTQVARAGPAADALWDSLEDTVFLDDGSGLRFPSSVMFPNPELGYDNTVRVGDTVENVEGPLAYAYGAWRIHVTPGLTQPSFRSSNPRPNNPPNVGEDSLKVASFNVLNYFNGPSFPTARGADTLEEFTRQRRKIISAISGIDAAILGLVEIENDGFGPESAIQDLVNGLNDATSDGQYRFVDPLVSGGTIGSDRISVKFIYQPAKVTPVGPTAIMDSSVDPRFDMQRNRPSLAQTFQQVRTKSKVLVVNNHLRSKGTPCPDDGDVGQGNCNLVRNEAAKAIGDWLQTDPTGQGVTDMLIIGDMNAYHMEDPIQTLIGKGFTDLIDTYQGKEKAYSYVFDGLSGYLDHALASTSLLPKVTGVGDWHINCDEPKVLDYNVEDKSAAQISDWYNSGAFRSSDHDPVVIGLNLREKERNRPKGKGDTNAVTETNVESDDSKDFQKPSASAGDRSRARNVDLLVSSLIMTLCGAVLLL